MAVAKNGVFVDTRTGKLVQSQPEEGIQVVAPGGEIPEHVAARLSGRTETATAPKVETATTESVSPKSKK